VRGLFARFSKLPDFDFQAFSTVFIHPCRISLSFAQSWAIKLSVFVAIFAAFVAQV
jgi:hypothetical protein